MNATHQAAIEYLSKGLSVVPLWPGRKRARVKWEAYQEKRASEAQLAAWWRAFPDANVGMVTGAISGVIVVDVDTYKGGSTEGLPPTGVIQRTGRGGLQYFYAHPGFPVANNQTEIPGHPGIDIRGDGGYVAVAPSDTTGNPDNDGEGGVYSWVSEDWDNLGTAPDWAIKPVEKEPEERTPSTEKWAVALLEGGAPEGGRNNACVRLAGYFAAKQFPLDVSLSLARLWNDTLDKPLPDGELSTTVRSAHKAERRKHRSSVALTPEESEECLPMLTLDQYMAKHGGALTNWLIKEWMPDATIAFLISPPQSYKTYAVFDLAVSVASGADFLGRFPVTNPGPVAVFQQEDPHPNIAERFALIAASRMDREAYSEAENGELTIPIIDHRDLPIFFHEERKLRFDDPEMMDALEAFVAKTRPRMCIIDPLYSAAGSEEYMMKAAQQMLRLKTIRDDYGCSFVVVHHTTKALESWDRQGLWGSQFLNAFIETSWMMRRPANENSVVLLRHFKVSGPQPFVRLTYDMQTDKLPWHYNVACEDISAKEAELVMQKHVAGDDAPRQSEKPNRNETRILEWLDMVEGATLEEIAARLSLSEKVVDKVLRALLHKHRVSQDKLERWHSLNPKENDDGGSE